MKKYLSFLILIVIFYSCTKDSELEPSNLDENWFERTDDAANEIDHQIYEVYKDTKVAILYKDTIATQDRGTDGTYSYLVDLNYSLYNSVRDSIKHSLVQEEDDILDGVKFIKEQFIEKLTPEFYPNSILLADDLYYMKDGWQEIKLDLYKGFNCLAIGNISDLKSKTEEEKTELAVNLRSIAISSKLPNLYKEDINKFYEFNFSKDWQIFYYGYEIASWYSGDNILGNMLPTKKPEEYGFIKYTDNWGDYTLCSKSEDLQSYVNAVVSDNEEEFMEKYHNYSLVVGKYRLIKEIIDKIKTK